MDFAVSNRAGVEAFLRDVAWEDLPLGAFLVGVRKVREERERVEEEGRREDRESEKVRKGDREGGEVMEMEMEMEMDGVEEDDEDEYLTL